jgi:hypothetical protein
MRPLNMVKLYISCRKLPKLDYASATDPKVVVFIREEKETAWSKVGSTEALMNSYNPDFSETLDVNY